MGYSTTPNFLDKAYSAGQISTAVFALGLSSNSTHSILYYDDIPQNVTDGTVMIDINSDNYWQVGVIGFLANDDDITGYAAANAVIDSGTSYL